MPSHGHMVTVTTTRVTGGTVCIRYGTPPNASNACRYMYHGHESEAVCTQRAAPPPTSTYLVAQEDGGVHDEGAGDGHPLLLAAAKGHAALAH